MKNNLIFIGLGQTGNNILHSLQTHTDLIQDPDKQAFYINFSATDLSKKFKGKQLLLDEGGTGKSPERGSEIVIKHEKTIHTFLEKIAVQSTNNSEIVLITSLGGGTGSSLTPKVIDFLSSYKLNISLVAIKSSIKEGAVSLPNFITNFQSLFNNYVLKNRLKSFLIFDNELFEKISGLNTYDYNSINEYICYYMKKIFDDSYYTESTEGFPALDLQEKKRVQYHGNGMADFVSLDLDKGQELQIKSSICKGGYKTSSAKTVFALIKFKDKVQDVEEKQSFLKYIDECVSSIKKKYSSAFFVFGYNFNNPKILKQIEINIFSNGNDISTSLKSNTKSAVKVVDKIKRKKEEFKIDSSIDLSF
jgi:cell division GTPase FtsZ